jgi:hypothetical protein
MGVDVAEAALAAGQGVVATGRNTGTVTAIPGAKPRLVQVAGRANVLNLDVIPYVAFKPTHALALRHATEAVSCATAAVQ